MRLRSAVAILALSSVAFAQDAPNPLDVLVRTVGKIESPEVQANILRGMNATLKGKSGVPAPNGWPELYGKLKASPNAEVRDLAQSLGAVFGSSAVLDEMRAALADSAAPMDARKTALESLGAAKDAASLPAILALLAEPGPLRAIALRQLAGFDDPRTAPAILAAWQTLDTAEKRDALNTLAGRVVHARALVAAITAGTVARAEVSAPLARQLQGLNDPDIDAWLAKTWGAVKTSSADKQAQIAKYKEFLHPDLILRADVNRGRAIFAQSCVVCHILHGTGGRVGPELPGAFEDSDYLLQNILDPNATIGKDYQQTFITTKDGQAVSGIVTAEDADGVTLTTLGAATTIARGRIAEMKLSEQSMMPEGLLAALDEQGVRDLFLYLRQRQQVPMLATALNANDASDFTRWHASDKAAWSMDGGELTGRNAAARPVSLVSEMVADSFRFTAKIKVTGANAAAEIAVRGREEQDGFAGLSLSLGGPTPANFWLYTGRAVQPESKAAIPVDPAQWVQLEVIATAAKTEVKLNGQPAFTLDAPARRTALAFHLSRGELRVKDARLEVLE